MNFNLVSSKVINEIFEHTGTGYLVTTTVILWLTKRSHMGFTSKTTEHQLLMLNSTVSRCMEMQEACLQLRKKHHDVPMI